MQAEVTDVVRRGLVNQRATPELTWSFLKEALSRARLDELKERGSTAIEDYVAAFDDEIAAKQDRLDRAEAENQRLRAELRRVDAGAEAVGEGILVLGKERPYYPGELRDAVVKALVSARQSLPSDSRVRHIVDDLVMVNPLSDAANEIEEALRRALETGRQLRAPERAILERIGLQVSEAGKHLKAVYHGDDRYTFTIPTTSSDHRAGKNLISQIRRRIL